MVRLSLSLKNRVPSSSIREIAGPQLAPPSVERLTSTALRAPTASAAPVKAMPICRTVGPLTATQGSDARANTPPAHCVNGAACGVLQVAPPSTETAVARPRAPPSDKRSCCHAATRWFGSEGLIARCDSTSAFAYAVAPAGTAQAGGAEGCWPCHPDRGGRREDWRLLRWWRWWGWWGCAATGAAVAAAPSAAACHRQCDEQDRRCGPRAGGHAHAIRHSVCAHELFASAFNRT